MPGGGPWRRGSSGLLMNFQFSQECHSSRACGNFSNAAFSMPDLLVSDSHSDHPLTICGWMISSNTIC
jgi:hypothetical protein